MPTLFKAASGVLKSRRADVLGLSSSALCLAHCLLLPVVYAAMQAYGTWGAEAHSEAEGFSTDYVFALLSLVAVVAAFRQAAAWYVRAGLLLGYAVFLIGLLMAMRGLPEYLVHVGSAMLLLSHGANFRLGHKYAVQSGQCCTVQ